MITTVVIVHSIIQFTIGFWFSENIEKSSYLGNKFINLLYSCNVSSFSLFILYYNVFFVMVMHCVNASAYGLILIDVLP